MGKIFAGLEVPTIGPPIMTRIIISPHNEPRVMFTFAKSQLHPTWKLHSGTCKDEIGSPLWCMVVGIHGIQTFKVVVVVLLFLL
jgi:hypothetical protein